MPHQTEILKVPHLPELPGIMPHLPDLYPSLEDEPEIGDEGDSATITVPVDYLPEMDGEFVPDLYDRNKKDEDEEDHGKNPNRKKRKKNPIPKPRVH